MLSRTRKVTGLLVVVLLACMAKADVQLDRKLPEVRFDKVALADVIDFLRDGGKRNIFVNWQSLKRVGIEWETPVSVNLKNVKVEEVLTQVLKAAAGGKEKARYVIDDGIFKISAVPDAKYPAQAVTMAKLPEKLDRNFPEVKAPGGGFADTLDFLRDVSGATITADWEALKKAGIDKETQVAFRLSNVRMSVILKMLLEAMGDGKTPLQVTFKDNVINITTGPEPKKPTK